MTIEITRWQPLRHAGNGIASFNFRIRGVTVRAAMLVRKEDGLGVTMPFTRHRLPSGTELTAVGLEYDDLQAVKAAAVARYRQGVGSEPDDAGLRRVLCAGGRESLEAAGI